MGLGGPRLRAGAVLWSWRDMGAEEHSSGSGEMDKGYGKVLEF